MDADQVFKVPSLKKKRPSLYCRETLDGLDGIWKQNSKAVQDPENSANLSSNFTNTISSTQNRMEVSNPSTQAEINNRGFKTELPNSGQCSSHSKYVYAVGLLNELCKTVECSDEQSRSNDSNDITDEMFPSSCSSDEDVGMTPLIVPDESLVDADTDCYVDWHSLTPPAPRSPGDHTVPDLYDLQNIYPPSECLAHTYDYLASTRFTAPTPEMAGIRAHHLLPQQRSSSGGVSSIPPLDHIVPDFYI